MRSGWWTGVLAGASLLALAGGSAVPSASSGWTPHADWILAGGQVVTVDKAFTLARAVAIKDGRVIAVGSEASIDAHRGPATKVIDLKGRAVLPGLQDSHIHFLNLGRNIHEQADLTLARSAADILEAVSALKKRLDAKPGQWLLGERWDQYKYPEMVTRWQLDEVAPANPVRLDRTYRGVAVNSAVFRLMGIDDEKPATWPAWWEKDPADFTFEDKIYRAKRQVTIDGRTREMLVPTGVFLGTRGPSLVTTRAPRPTLEDDVRSARWGVEEMLRLGVTSVVDPSSRMGYMVKVYQEAYNRGFMQIRMASVYEGTFTQTEPAAIAKRLDEVKINNIGDGFLRWRGAKFYADGGAGTRSAWVSEPFANWRQLEGAENFGLPVVSDNGVREAQFLAALERGWELHTHACGDVAMRQTVDLYIKLMNEVRKERPDADLRWSVIHAYHPVEPRTNMLKEMAAHGIIALVNPVFNWQEGAAFVHNLGEERMARTTPFRSYVKAGVLMASGSDYNVTSHDPWIGIYALLTRRDQATGKVYGPDETIGIEDALRSYTINGAFLTYDDKVRGSLEVGKLADLVVLDLPDIRDLERNPDLCFQMRDKVLLTMVEGKVRYGRGELEQYQAR
ncbi:MAG TPA: amidohydrolase [Vicinamibacterales bacterium]|nr:amidohydrolase [Vicinamibacterales bacterium]